MARSRRNRPYTKLLAPSGGDDKPALQAALNSAASGWYKEIVIDGYLAMASGASHGGGNNGLILRGTSRWTSGLRAIAGAETADLLTLGSPTSGYNGHQVVRDLAFKSAVTKTGGCAVSINNAGETATVEGCSIYNTYDGVRLTGGSIQAQIRNNDIYLYDAGQRDGIRIDYTGTPGYGTETWIVDNTMYGQLGAAGVGINVLNGDALHVRGNSVVAFGTNFQIDPNQNHTPETGYYLITDNIFSDCGGSYNVYVNGATYQVSKLQFTANHIVYAGLGATAGAHVVGTNLNGVRFSGCYFGQNYGGAGLLIGTAAKNISVQDSTFVGNFGDGIEVASGVTGFQIIGNRMISGNMGGGVSITQDYGIRYGGSHSDAIVAMNDLRGNGTAATTGTAPSTNSYVAGNIS